MAPTNLKVGVSRSLFGRYGASEHLVEATIKSFGKPLLCIVPPYCYASRTYETITSNHGNTRNRALLLR